MPIIPCDSLVDPTCPPAFRLEHHLRTADPHIIATSATANQSAEVAANETRVPGLALAVWRCRWCSGSTTGLERGILVGRFRSTAHSGCHGAARLAMQLPGISRASVRAAIVTASTASSLCIPRPWSSSGARTREGRQELPAHHQSANSYLPRSYQDK